MLDDRVEYCFVRAPVVLLELLATDADRFGVGEKLLRCFSKRDHIGTNNSRHIVRQPLAKEFCAAFTHRFAPRNSLSISCREAARDAVLLWVLAFSSPQKATVRATFPSWIPEPFVGMNDPVGISGRAFYSTFVNLSPHENLPCGCFTKCDPPQDGSSAQAQTLAW